MAGRVAVAPSLMHPASAVRNVIVLQVDSRARARGPEFGTL